MNFTSFTSPFLEEHLVELTSIDDFANVDAIKLILDEWGFAIVNNIFTNAECIGYEKLFMDTLLNSIDVTHSKNPTIEDMCNSVKNRKLPFPKNSIPGLPNKGFMSQFNHPHSEFAWKIRSNEKLRYIYSVLNGCLPEDMCVSTDVNFYCPDVGPSKRQSNWVHADQNTYHKTGSENSYQAIVNITDGTHEDTSGTVLLPKSHVEFYDRLMQELPNEYKTNHTHFAKISSLSAQSSFFNEIYQAWNANSRRIPLKAGSVLIFNSKLLHQGYSNGRRLSQTVCWEKKSLRTDEALHNKILAVVLGIPTTHWASLGQHHSVYQLKLHVVQQYIGENHHSSTIPLEHVKNYGILDCMAFDTEPMRQYALNRTFIELMGFIKPEILEML